MSKDGIIYLNQPYFYGGISQSSKIGIKGSFSFGQRLNIFDEPTQISIMPQSVKVSGTTVTDLVKWAVSGAPYDSNIYFYSENGKLYVQNGSGTWSLLRSVSNSHGQGLEMFQDYLYYATDTDVGRYGPLDGSPTFNDTWGSTTGVLSEGGAGTINNTSTTKFAPLKVFTGGMAFGNGNQLSWWDGSVFVTDMLTFLPGVNVRALEITDQYLVIGVWRGTSVTSNEFGRLYFWDGASVTFNQFVNIPQGGCMALLNYKNRILTFAGSNGQLLMNYSPFSNVQNIPNLGIGNSVEIYPGAVTNWRGLAQLGVAGSTDSSTVYQGVYTFGSKTQLYPEVLNYSFSISTSTTQGTGVKIGCLYGQGNDLYIGWKDGSNYGVDKVTNSNTPFVSATYESLIWDNNELYKDKLLKRLKVYHSPLATGESISIGLKINRAASYTSEVTNSTVGSTETKAIIAGTQGRFREMQYQITLSGSGTSPTVYYTGAELDELPEAKVY
jgi:hypothetical protein